MYGYRDVLQTGSEKGLANEIAFQNLISIFNNATLFNALDKEAQDNLMKIIVSYAKISMNSILVSGYTYEEKKIREDISKQQ